MLDITILFTIGIVGFVFLMLRQNGSSKLARTLKLNEKRSPYCCANSSLNNSRVYLCNVS